MRRTVFGMSVPHTGNPGHFDFLVVLLCASLQFWILVTGIFGCWA